MLTFSPLPSQTESLPLLSSRSLQLSWLIYSEPLLRAGSPALSCAHFPAPPFFGSLSTLSGLRDPSDGNHIAQNRSATESRAEPPSLGVAASPSGTHRPTPASFLIIRLPPGERHRWKQKVCFCSCRCTFLPPFALHWPPKYEPGQVTCGYRAGTKPTAGVATFSSHPRATQAWSCAPSGARAAGLQCGCGTRKNNLTRDVISTQNRKQETQPIL